MKRKHTAVLLAGAWLFFSIHNVFWLLRDTLPPAWDQAVHADYCLTYFRLFSAPLKLSLTKLLAVSPYWPPFFYWTTVPLSLLFGYSFDVLALTNILFLAILLTVVTKIGERLFDGKSGLGAAIVTILYPIVYALSREILLDFALLAMVALAQYVILITEAGTNRKRSWLLGLVLGLAVLTKWTAVAFVAGPLIYVFVDTLSKKRPPAGEVLKSLGIAVAVFLIVAAPWYAEAAKTFFRGAQIALESDAVREGDPTRLWPSVLWYGKALKDTLVSGILGVFTLIGLAVFFFRVRNKRAIAFLSSWVLPALFVFFLIPNKDPRNIAPLLPALALWTSAGLNALKPRLVRGAAWSLLVLAGLFQFYAISFGRPWPMSHGYTHPPQAQDWKVETIVKSIESLYGNKPIAIAVLANIKTFQPNAFKLQAHRLNLPYIFDAIGDSPVTFAKVATYHVLISKTGSLAVAHTRPNRLDFRRKYNQALKEGDLRSFPFWIWNQFPLPDGKSAVVFVRVEDPPKPDEGRRP
ncbi:MAG: ArnT family glycosyltransferase [Candidatus Aminicenantales bacterium]